MSTKFESQTWEDIRDYILNPDMETSLTPPQKAMIDRCRSAAKLMDKYPSDDQVASMLTTKYDISRATAYRDIQRAREYMADQEEHRAFLLNWLHKEMVEFVETAKKNGDSKWQNAGHRNLLKLHETLKETEVAPEKEKAMEPSTFYLVVGDTERQEKDLIKVLNKISRAPRKKKK